MKRHLAAAILFLLICSVPASAVTRTVPTQYPTIQAAVDACLPGDVVQVMPGVYRDVNHRPDQDTTRCAVIMKSSITVRGSGIGLTIVDCQMPGGRRGRGFHCQGITNSTIENLTVRGAFAQTYGAGIFCLMNTSLTIRYCEITGNHDGGVISILGSSPTIYGCWFTNNVGKEGGGLLAESGAPSVRECQFFGNTAPAGGAIYARSGANLAIRDCIVSGNETAGPGGGIVYNGATGAIETSTIEDNAAGVPGGGGIYTTEATVTVTGCMIRKNYTFGSSGAGGGLFLDFHSSATITDCTIIRNAVRGFDPGPPAADGGGICAVNFYDLVIRQCTIAADSCAIEQGGGIALRERSGDTDPIIDKCIIANNGPGRGLWCELANPVVSCTDLYGNQGGNQICGTDGGHNFSLDPLFCAPGDYDFRLQANSPCAPGHHPDGANACGGSRLGSEDVGCTPLSVPDPAGSSPASLLGNAPNPFAPATSIRFSLARSGRAVLSVFDVAGRVVRTLQDGYLPAGPHQVTWDGRGQGGERLSSGIYFYRLSVDGVVQTRSMVLAR